MNLSGISAAAGTTNSSQKDPQILGKDDFLKLLVTQLKYQDPLKPMDDKEFIAQTAQFSTLEEMQNLNKTFTSGIDKLVSSQEDTLATMMYMLDNWSSWQVLGSSFNLVGREVTAETSAGTVTGIVEKVKIVDGVPKAIVSGSEVAIEAIKEVGLHNGLGEIGESTSPVEEI
jgi:flagellar basal-body rod modification protein FlgD